MPVDIVARAVLDLSQINEPWPNTRDASISTEDASIVYHVQNPRLFHWTHDLLPALHDVGLQFQAASQQEWVQRLRSSEKNPELNPTIKLVDFFAEKYDNDKPGRKGLVFLTEKSGQKSQAIRDGYDIIGSGIVKKFVDSWKIVE